MKHIHDKCHGHGIFLKPLSREHRSRWNWPAHCHITAGWRAWRVILPPLFWCLCVSSASAQSLFSVEITVGDAMETFRFDNVENVIEQVDEDKLRAAFPNYEETSRANAVIDWRGVSVELSFDDSNSLTFRVPLIGEERVFKSDSGNRDDSADELLEFLKGEGDSLLNALQKALIAKSPVDPIAGNPSSLATSQIVNQFEAGFTDQVTMISEVPDASVSADSPSNDIVFGTQFAQFEANKKRSNAITLPFGYKFNFQSGEHGLRSLNLSLPLTYIEVESAQVVQGFLDIGLTYAMNEHWSLSPAVGVGGVGSIDLGSAGGITTTSLTSAYTIPQEEYVLSIGNMVGYSNTLDIEIGDYSFNPDVSNTVLRNGVMLSIPSSMWGSDVTSELWFTDTRFFGDELYSEYYHEFGISFGTVETDDDMFSVENYLRLGLSYLTGDGVDGWSFNLGYTF